MRIARGVLTALALALLAGASLVAAAGEDPRIVRRGTGIVLRQDATNEDLASLRDEKGITSLSLGATMGGVAGPYMTADGLAHIAGWTELRELRILGAGPHAHRFINKPEPGHITDDALRHLKDLAKLERLELVQTRITDKGLATLAGIKTLETLDVRGSRVTDAGISALEKRRPDLELRRGE